MKTSLIIAGNNGCPGTWRPKINDSINLRRHRNACQFYRENWQIDGALYQCLCLRDTPPLTEEEQERCFTSKHGCWRDKVGKRRSAAARLN